jgi:hypothetical protein
MIRAAETGRPEAVRLLAVLGFDVNAVRRITALHQAAWAGDLDMVRLLLELGADPTLLDQSFNATPLGWARHNQQHEVAAYLEALAQPEAVSPASWSRRPLGARPSWPPRSGDVPGAPREIPVAFPSLS